MLHPQPWCQSTPTPTPPLPAFDPDRILFGVSISGSSNQQSMCLPPPGSDFGPPSQPLLSATGAGAYLCEQEALWPRPGRPSLPRGSLAGHSRGHMAPTEGQASGWGKAGLRRVALGQERDTGPHLANGPPGLRAEGGAKGGEAMACPRPCGPTLYPSGAVCSAAAAAAAAAAAGFQELPGRQVPSPAGTRLAGS